MQALYHLKTGDAVLDIRFDGYKYDGHRVRLNFYDMFHSKNLEPSELWYPVPGMRVKINGNQAIVVRQNGVCVLERGIWTFQEGLEGLTLEDWEPDRAWDAFSGQLTGCGRYLSNGFFWNGREIYDWESTS